MKELKWLTFIGLILFISWGCATPIKQSAITNMKSMNSLQIVRTKPQCLAERTLGSQAVAMTGVMFGAIGGAISGGISMEVESRHGRELAEKYALPDYGALVFNNFADLVQKDFPDWPKPVVKAEPVNDEDYKCNGYTIVLCVNQVVLDATTASTVLRAWTVAKMNDPDGNVVWEKEVMYKSSDYSRSHSLEQFEADNGELLKDELNFSAEKTTADLIHHLKYGNSVEKPAGN
ncbi:MAG: hypothetical protein ACLQVJ_28050 [Syntrophobacteraceae bacterium]